MALEPLVINEVKQHWAPSRNGVSHPDVAVIVEFHKPE